MDVGEALKEMTGGAVLMLVLMRWEMEAHGTGPDAFYDQVKCASGNRPTTAYDKYNCRLSQRWHCVNSRCLWRLYRQDADGAAMNKGLTFKMGQTHVRYPATTARTYSNGDIDPSFVITTA